MSDTIRAFVMHESGNIPGIPGVFGGGQTVYVDMDTREVVSQQPILPPTQPANEELAKQEEDTQTEEVSQKDVSRASDENGE